MISIPIAAAALGGAQVVEKHLTLDRNLPDLIIKPLFEPHELKDMVKPYATVNKLLGTGRKIPNVSELHNRTVARKSLVVLKKINKERSFPGQLGG